MPSFPLTPQSGPPNTGTSNPGTITAILVGQVSDPKKAQSMALAAQSCPYTALYTIQNDTIIGVFTLPRSEQEWIEYPQEKPVFLQMDKVLATVVTDCIQADSPWLRGNWQAGPELGEPRDEQCSHYPEKCHGCPATLFYLAAE